MMVSFCPNMDISQTVKNVNLATLKNRSNSCLWIQMQMTYKN